VSSTSSSRSSDRRSAALWSVAGQLSRPVAALVVTPVLLTRLGAERFGLYTLLITGLAVLTSLDGGIGASVLRFAAVHRARDDVAALGRFVRSVLLLAVATSGVVAAVAWFAADAIVELLGPPHDVRVDSVLCLRFLGPALVLNQVTAVLVGALGSVLRYDLIAVANVLGQLVFVAIVLLASHAMSGALWAIVAGQAASLLVLVTAARGMTSGRGLLGPLEWRELLGFGARTQLTSITALVNLEVDAVVVAAFLPLRDVAVYGIAASVASLLRNLPLWMLPPAVSELSSAFGSQGRFAALRLAHHFQRNWATLLLLWTGVSLSASLLGVQLWLGPDYSESGLAALVLVVGNSVNLATGVWVAFANSVGEAGLEARYGVVVMVVNLALTVPGVLLFGVIGVVGATALGQVVGSLYFLRLARRHFSLAPHEVFGVSGVGVGIVAAVAVALPTAGLVALGEHGVAPLALAAVVAVLLLWAAARRDLRVLWHAFQS
jgi:O-antigen/teichoic acid export membrane protein